MDLDYYTKYKKYKSKLKNLKSNLNKLEIGGTSTIECLCQQSSQHPINLNKSNDDNKGKLLEIHDINGIQEELRNNGYVVIQNAISREEVTQAQTQILNYLHQLPRTQGNGINLSDITTKLDDSKKKELWRVWPMHKTFGAPTELDIFHLHIFWKIRENKLIYQLYTSLLNTKRLLANIDRACIKLPTVRSQKKKDEFLEFIHIDRDPTHWTDTPPLQSMIFFNDSKFYAIPKSHTKEFHKKIVKSYNIQKHEKPRSMCMIDQDIDKQRLNLRKQLKPITVPKGSLIIWSENLWHASLPNNTDYIRLALYFGYHRLDNGESPNTQEERTMSFISGRLPPKLPGGEKVYLVPKKYYNFPKKILPYLDIIPPEYHGTHTIKSTKKVVPWIDEKKYDPLKINKYQPYKLTSLGEKLLGIRDWETE